MSAADDVFHDLLAAARMSGYPADELERLAQRGLLERLEDSGRWVLPSRELAIVLARRRLKALLGVDPDDAAFARLAAAIRWSFEPRGPRWIAVPPSRRVEIEPAGARRALDTEGVVLQVAPRQLLDGLQMT